MANALATLTEQFKPLFPRFEEALAGAMPVERMMQTVMVAAEGNPKILDANRQTLFNAAMGACLLRLPVDGVTGQAYLVPYSGRVQLLAGYQGLITLAARSTFVCHADLVREKDKFKHISGSNPLIEHEHGNGTKIERGAIVGAYAVYRSKHFPSVLRFMDRAELDEVNSGRNVWKSNPEAMMLKTPIRRAAKLLPMDTAQDLGVAIALEEQHDLGHHAEVTADMNVKVDKSVTVETTEPDTNKRLQEAAKPYELDADPLVIQCLTPKKFATAFLAELETAPDWKKLFKDNKATLKRIRKDDPASADLLAAEYKKCKG
jgi:recombination protein RecT